eukprot:scaffold62421_cov69-Phaeocystis_antarctica.AAC.6
MQPAAYVSRPCLYLEKVVAVLGEELVSRLACALPTAVIVDDEQCAGGQPRCQDAKLCHRRVEPVCVEPEQRDLLRQLLTRARERVLHLALCVVDTLGRILRALYILSHDVDGPIVPSHLAAGVDIFATIAAGCKILGTPSGSARLLPVLCD